MNRELDALKSVRSKAVEWGKPVESPARRVKRLRVENRRMRILTPDEERSLLNACQGKFRALVALAPLTGARRGELLALEWSHVTNDETVYVETKNDRSRRLPMTPSVRSVLANLFRVRPWVFTNPATGSPTRRWGRTSSGR